MSFLRHARSIGPMWVLASCKAEPECRLPLVGPGVRHKGATEIAPPLIVRDESHRLFLGGLLSSRARLRFTSRTPVCCNVVLPVEIFSANGEQCLNRLCQPRGQAQCGFYNLCQFHRSLRVTSCSLR
jgi:hypothetical protein